MADSVYYDRNLIYRTTPYGPTTQVSRTYRDHHNPTIRAFQPFNPDNDAKALRKAFKGMGTDEDTVIKIICNRTQEQRRIIEDRYYELFNKDLFTDLKKELSGTLENVITALMQTPEEFSATEVHKAIAGAGTSEEDLIEILLTLNERDKLAMREYYGKMFKREVIDDIVYDTSGYFRHLLFAIITTSRQEEDEIYMRQAYHEAYALWENGPKTWSKLRHFTVPIFAGRSYAHLNLMFEDYKAISNIDILKDIERELSGDEEKFFSALVKVIRNKNAYFAERLYNAFKGAGVREDTVVRILVSRSEKDLRSISAEYQRLYGKSLAQAIKDDFKGDARKVLLDLITLD